MTSYFISAIGTNVGKTLVTCALTHQLRKQNRNVRAVKPIISGFDASHPQESDTAALITVQGLPLSPQAIESISPWRFAAPLSPDMAAEDEGKAIDVPQLINFCRGQKADTVFIEGIGGIMVPLNREYTVLNWMRALNIPVILVAGSYLGALNHTLLSTHAVLSSGLTLHGVVISESETSAVSLARTEATLRRFLPQETRVASIARLDSSVELWKDVSDLTSILFG